MKLSVVVPVFNEEENVRAVYEELIKILSLIKYEIIFVNDGSNDKTEEKLYELHRENKNVKVINFKENYGKDVAMYAGIKYASGKYTAIIDGDMQQDPKYLLSMYEFLENNLEYDQVCMIPNKRNDMSWFKKASSKLFYKIINLVSNTKFVEDASDFRMFNKIVKETVLKRKETKFLKGVFNDKSFDTKYMYYDVLKRKNGKSKFTLDKSINYATIGIANYIDKPLYNFFFLGIIFVIIGMLLFKKPFWYLWFIIGFIMAFIGGLTMYWVEGKRHINKSHRKRKYVIKSMYGINKK